MSKKVLITDYVWPSVEPERAILSKIGVELILAPNGDESTLVELAGNVHGILTCFAKVTESVIRAANQCVVIGRYGVGVDNIEVDTATELGIAVTYVPDYCVDEVSDHVLAFLLGWNRRVVMFDKSVKSSGWDSIPLTMRIMRLRGKKLGIIGFGRIGQAVCKKAQVFGLEILAHDPFASSARAADFDAKLVDMQTLLSQSDFITIHAPSTPQTINMIGEKEFSMMKPEAFLINAARGSLIDESALYDALTGGQIAGAGVDVLVDSAPPDDHQLFRLNNLLVTPHVAFFSQESTLELEERAATEVSRVIQGLMPDNLVNPNVLKNARSNLKI